MLIQLTMFGSTVEWGSGAGKIARQTGHHDNTASLLLVGPFVLHVVNGQAGRVVRRVEINVINPTVGLLEQAIGVQLVMEELVLVFGNPSIDKHPIDGAKLFDCCFKRRPL